MPVDPSQKSNPARLRRLSRKDSDDLKPENSNYAREIELKRSRGEISCAECRRLKIRCDKTIPCQSCQRRGCAALCPNGSLATGQGTRFVLAATEHLHRRIAKMSDRIRELEDALAILQGRSSDEPHPLLTPGQSSTDQSDAAIERAVAISQSVIDTFGMLSVTERGKSTFFGPTGGTEYLLVSDQDTNTDSSPVTESELPNSRHNSQSPPVVDAIPRFSASFPFTPLGPPHSIHDLIESYLPPYDRAQHLAQLYFEHAAWIFKGIPREQLMDEMLPHFYRNSMDSSPPPAIMDYNGPHDLALLLFIFAIGALVDFSQEPYNSEAEHYDQLAQAALCLKPIWAKSGITTIQALHLSSIYNAMAGNEIGTGDTSMERSWGMLSLAAQLSQNIGLHRDSARWELPEALVNRRRLVFWNIFTADAWQSLTTGRPPSFSRVYIDCKYPTIDEAAADDGKEEPHFGDFFMRFAYDCVAEVAVKTLTAEPPSYETIMELDRQVREFPIPPGAIAQLEGLAPPADCEPQSMTMTMQYIVYSHSREVLLLYIHRSFFAQALIDHPTNPVRSTYAHSFLSAYRAAGVVLKTIKDEFTMFPNLTARMWPVWTYAFSAAMVFGMVVTRGPRSPLASAAMGQLIQACDLFTQASHHSRRAAKALLNIVKLREKAEISMSAVHKGPSDMDDTEAAYGVKAEDNADELAIFAGRARSTVPRPHSDSPSRKQVTYPAPPAVVPPTPSTSTQPAPFVPSQQQEPSGYSVPNATMHDWASPPTPSSAVPQAYQTQNLDPWYHTSDHPQHQPVHGYPWPSHPEIPQQQAVHVRQHHGQGMMHSYHEQAPMMPLEGYRDAHQMYSGPAAYTSSAELIDLGLASSGSGLDARWAAMMQDPAFTGSLKYR